MRTGNFSDDFREPQRMQYIMMYLIRVHNSFCVAAQLQEQTAAAQASTKSWRRCATGTGICTGTAHGKRVLHRNFTAHKVPTATEKEVIGMQRDLHIYATPNFVQAVCLPTAWVAVWCCRVCEVAATRDHWPALVEVCWLGQRGGCDEGVAENEQQLFCGLHLVGHAVPFEP